MDNSKLKCDCLKKCIMLMILFLTMLLFCISCGEDEIVENTGGNTTAARATTTLTLEPTIKPTIAPTTSAIVELPTATVGKTALPIVTEKVTQMVTSYHAITAKPIVNHTTVPTATNKLTTTPTATNKHSTTVNPTNTPTATSKPITTVNPTNTPTATSKPITIVKPTVKPTTTPIATKKPVVHTHYYLSATCTSPAKCACGEIKGYALGHNYKCNKCVSCGMFDDEVQLIAENIIGQIIEKNMSEWQKVESIHNYLCENVTYDLENFKNNTIPEESHSVIGVFNKHVAVCDGYALSFELLCEIIDVECEVVRGFGCNGIGHAWNQVRIDGKWYNVDVTWDDYDKNIFGYTYGYKYFLVPDYTFYKDHETNNAKHICDSKSEDIIKMCMSCTDLLPIEQTKCSCGSSSFRPFNH